MNFFVASPYHQETPQPWPLLVTGNRCKINIMIVIMAEDLLSETRGL